MSAEEFWKDDPQLFVSYRTFFINNKKRELEEMDYKCWLQGLYIHNGNGILLSSLKQFIANIISKNKDNTKIDTYPIKPYIELDREKQNEQKEKEKEENRKKKYKEYENSLIYFGTLKQQYTERLKNKNLKGE